MGSGLTINPRNWSSQTANRMYVALVVVGTCLVLTAFALEWRGRQLSDIRIKHKIERDVNGYYQRPLGVDLGERYYISRQQAETYFQYGRYRQWAGYASWALLLAVVVIVILRRRVEQPPI